MTDKNLKVPAELLHQLKILAAQRGTTMKAMVSEWIKREVAEASRS